MIIKRRNENVTLLRNTKIQLQKKKDECTMEDNGQFNNVRYNGRYNLKW